MTAHPDPEMRWLVVSSARGVFRRELGGERRLTLGRAPENDLVVDDDSVSREHAVIHVGDPFSIEDRGSRNGTYVLGHRLQPGARTPLPLGTVAMLGAAMVVVVRGAAMPTLTQSTPSDNPDDGPIVRDPAMQQLYALLDVIAPVDLSVLVLGETGTGKELYARTLHARSKRGRKPGRHRGRKRPVVS